MLIFHSYPEALESMQRCEAKECSIIHSAHSVTIRTPEGYGCFPWRTSAPSTKILPFKSRAQQDQS